MLRVNNLSGFGGGLQAEPLSVTYKDFADDATPASDTVTLSGMDFGAQAANRRIVCGIIGQGVSINTLSSATIGGISATIVVQAEDAPLGPDLVTAIVYAEVPYGLTGDVVAVFDDTPSYAGAFAYRTTGWTSSTDNGSDTGSNPLSLDRDIPSGDSFAIGIAQHRTATAGAAIAWVGLTEDHEDDGEDNTDPVSCASDTFSSSEVGRTITATCDQTATANCGVTAVFQ